MALLMAEITWQNALFLKDDFSDCEILVVTPSASYRFPCHRAILSSANAVFAKMFQCDCEEYATGKIVIKDTNPSDMLSILKYIYSGFLYIEDWKMACDVLKFAHKYNMSKLWQECENFLLENMTLDNVCKILEFSICYELNELKEECLKLCSKGFFAILRRKTFTELELRAFKEILSRQDLNVENEMVVFKVAWDRAVLECCRKERKVTDENVADEMKIFADCVGYEFMTNEEFESLPSPVRRIWQKTRKENVLKEEDCKLNISCVPDPVSEISNNCDVSSEPLLLKKREVHFPLGLQTHLTTFNMSMASVGTFSTGSLLLRFSFTSYVYLHDVTIVCYRNLPYDLLCKSDSSNKTAGFTFSSGPSSCPSPLFTSGPSSSTCPASVFTFGSKGTETSLDFCKPQILSLRVTSKDKTMEVPCKKIVNSFICQNQQHYSKVSKEVFKMKFEAVSLLLLNAGVEYVLEVCKSPDSVLNYNMTWPAVLSKGKVAKKVELRLHSTECYGLHKLRVIAAS